MNFDDYGFVLPRNASKRDIQDLNRAVGHARQALRESPFEPVVEKWLLNKGLLPALVGGPLEGPMRDILRFAEHHSFPLASESKEAQFLELYEEWAQRCRMPLRPWAWTFLAQHKIPPISLISVTVGCFQEIAFHALTGCDILVKEQVNMTIWATEVYQLPDGDLIADLPRTRFELGETIQHLDPTLRAALKKRLVADKSAGRPSSGLPTDVRHYFRRNLVGETPYQIAKDLGADPVDTNQVMRGCLRVERLLKLPILERR